MDDGDFTRGIFGIDAQIAAVLIAIIAEIMAVLALCGVRRRGPKGAAGVPYVDKLSAAGTFITTGLTIYYLVMAYRDYKGNEGSSKLFWILAANCLTFISVLIKLYSSQAAEEEGIGYSGLEALIASEP